MRRDRLVVDGNENFSKDHDSLLEPRRQAKDALDIERLPDLVPPLGTASSQGFG
jgi:hypothetical protein